jgi:hypothetical protein
MWTESYRDGPLSTDKEIRREIRSPSRSSTPRISISSEDFNEHYGFLEQNKTAVVTLRVVGATNEDIQKLSKLDSLWLLELPGCRATDFSPLVKLKKLYGLNLSNPNLQQFREERLLGKFKSLGQLTLYNVADLQAAVNLPGLKPVGSQEAKGIHSLTIQAPHWNPATRIAWPDNLRSVERLSVLGDRVRIGCDKWQLANIYLGRFATDDPSICSTRLRDVIEESGFYDGRQVEQLDLTSEHVALERDHAVEFDPTDIAPLKSLTGLKSLTLKGKFYGFARLKGVPLEYVHFLESSPSPSPEAVEVLSKHPTLKEVKETIESATEEILWKRTPGK